MNLLSVSLIGLLPYDNRLERSSFSLKLVAAGRSCQVDHDGISNSEGGSSGAEESFIPLFQALRFDVLIALVLRTQRATLTSKYLS